MKANYQLYNRRELDRKAHEAARDEVYRVRDEIHDAIEKDITYQALATAFTILHRDFGFGGQRLKALKKAIESEYVIMGKNPLNREYTPRDAQEWLKKQYGIDFEESEVI